MADHLSVFIMFLLFYTHVITQNMLLLSTYVGGQMLICELREDLPNCQDFLLFRFPPLIYHFLLFIQSMQGLFAALHSAFVVFTLFKILIKMIEAEQQEPKSGCVSMMHTARLEHVPTQVPPWQPAG